MDFIPSIPLIGRSPRGSMGGVRRAFDPMSLDPILALDFSLPTSRALKTGGTQAGYLDLVPTWENPGTASDATQGTSGSQPVYLAHTEGENYLHLPGVSGNYASVPDSAALDIVGDMDLRCLLPHPIQAGQTFISKGPGAYNFTENSGGLRFGSPGYSGVNSTSALPALFSGWVRVTRATNTITFFYSSDGTSWTQLGSTVDGSGISVGNTTDPLTVGGDSFGYFRGAFSRVRIFASANGTDERLDINFAAVTHGATSFTCATGQTVTINATGNNPAMVIGKPVAWHDGVDDFFTGTFSPALTGGRMFMLATVTGYSAFNALFVTGINDATTDYLDTQSAVWRVENGSAVSSVQYGGAATAGHAAGSFAGRHLHEVLIGPGGVVSRVDNADEKTGAAYATMASGIYQVGRRLGVGLPYSPAFFLEALWMLPANTPDAKVAKMRRWLNDTHSIGLALP